MNIMEMFTASVQKNGLFETITAIEQLIADAQALLASPEVTRIKSNLTKLLPQVDGKVVIEYVPRDGQPGGK